MYKKYIKKRGKLVGPYYYESVRLKTGKIKSVYVGRNPDSLEFKNKIALLRVQDAVSKGDIIVIPVEPGDVVHRPKRPDYLKPDLSALKEYFGEKISKIKANVALPKLKLPEISLPKIDISKFRTAFSKIKLPEVSLPKIKLPKVTLPKLKSIKLPKLKMPEFKFSKEFYQRKLEEYIPKPGLHDFDFHAALTILLSVIFVFGFFFLQNNFVGYSAIGNDSLFEEAVGQLEGQISPNLSDVVQESSAIPLVLNILNYSCNWNGSSFRVCESVEWSGGSYAKGYISGGDSIKDVEAFANSPFTYCQELVKEGKKAVNAYIFDENNKIVKQDLTNKVDCIVGNDTVIEISNATLEVNESNNTEVNETDLIS